MNLKATAIMVALLLLVSGTPATADGVYTTVADTIIDGNAGTILTMEELGNPIKTYFLFPQGGMIRVYASRDAGSPSWDILAGMIHLVPKNKIAAGDTWRFLDDEQGGETIAEAIVEESVWTIAGTFMAWRVDIALVSNPTVPIRSRWFASRVGLVRQVEYVDQSIASESILATYATNGNGYFPLVVGNVWTYDGGAVPVKAEVVSVGSFKARWGN
jgi:hypothetical protein